jgi:hypothetical protein
MDNIINTFYRGNINKFGFGGWNTTKNNIKEIIGEYPYPSNWNRQIDRYFQKSNIENQTNSRNEHYNYVPNEITKNIPISHRVDFSKSNAKELKPYNIITEDLIKDFKKRTKTLTSTTDKKKVLDDYFLYYYWSRREYELFIGDAFEEDISKYKKVDIYTQIQMNFDVIYELVVKATN